MAAKAAGWAAARVAAAEREGVAKGEATRAVVVERVEAAMAEAAMVEE